MLSVISFIYDLYTWWHHVPYSGRNYSNNSVMMKLIGMKQHQTKLLWNSKCCVLLYKALRYKPYGLRKVKEFWIHHLSEASEEVYGQVSFMRMANCVGAIHCNFIMGKARVTLKKYISIPHLELVAATLPVKIAKL